MVTFSGRGNLSLPHRHTFSTHSSNVSMKHELKSAVSGGGKSVTWNGDVECHSVGRVKHWRCGLNSNRVRAVVSDQIIVLARSAANFHFGRFLKPKETGQSTNSKTSAAFDCPRKREPCSCKLNWNFGNRLEINKHGWFFFRSISRHSSPIFRRFTALMDSP